MTEYGSNISSTSAFSGTVKGGTGTILAGNTSVQVAHGLGAAPSGYSVTPTTDSLGVDVFVSAVDATNITVAMDFVQAGNVAFAWTAVK